MIGAHDYGMTEARVDVRRRVEPGFSQKLR